MPAKRCNLRRLVVCDLLANVEIIALGLFPRSLPAFWVSGNLWYGAYPKVSDDYCGDCYGLAAIAYETCWYTILPLYHQ